MLESNYSDIQADFQLGNHGVIGYPTSLTIKSYSSG